MMTIRAVTITVPSFLAVLWPQRLIKMSSLVTTLRVPEAPVHEILPAVSRQTWTGTCAPHDSAPAVSAADFLQIIEGRCSPPNNTRRDLAVAGIGILHKVQCALDALPPHKLLECYPTV